MSLRGRLTLMSALIVGVILAAGAVVCFVVMRHQLRSQVDDQLVGQARLVQRVAPRAESFPRQLPALPRGAPQRNAPYSQLIVPSGQVLRPDGADAPLPVTPADLAVARGGAADLRQDRTVDGQHLRVVTVHIRGRGAIQLGRPLAAVDSTLASLRIVLALLVVGGLALAALASRLFFRPVLAPIEDLTEATEHIEATGDLGRRVNAERTDEVGRLATSFNAMLERVQHTQAALSESMTAQRQLVADASHELRTPVASLRTNIEVLLAGGAIDPDERNALMADVVEQTEELSAIVSDLIELARGDLPASDEEDLDLAAIAREAMTRAQRHAPHLCYAADIEAWPMTGSRERLGRALNNLLDNAAKFGPPGSTVGLRLRDGELVVRDEGPGVADADLPYIFDRFFRASDAGRLQGSGLGLAIVKQVVESHGGIADARRADAGGLEVRLRFQAPVT